MKRFFWVFFVMLWVLFFMACNNTPQILSVDRIITNENQVLTNVTVITNFQVVTNTAFSTETVIISNISYLFTNYRISISGYTPLPSVLKVYALASTHSSWTNPSLHWWNLDEGTSGDVLNLFGGDTSTNINGDDWWFFAISNYTAETRVGMKLRDGTADWNTTEPIKTENGALYDRIVYIPNFAKIEASTNFVTNGNVITQSIVRLTSTEDTVFVHTPANWWEGFPWFTPEESDLYRDMPSQNPWDLYMGASYYGNGVTVFTLYAPHVRRAYVAGDFSLEDGQWKKLPMYLSKDHTWWWLILSNTSPGQHYKFAAEKYPLYTQTPQVVFVADPASKRNAGSAMGDSVIVDPNSYTWQSSWTRPTDYGWYVMYQMHIRTFNAPGRPAANGTNDNFDWSADPDKSFWGWGTFRTAIDKMDELTNMGFNAIEPLPIQEFGGDQSWGYNYTLFYAPESAYCGVSGTEGADGVDNFKSFVDEAHKRGMAVIMDLVFNHMGASDDPVGSLDPANDWNNPQTYWYNGKTDWGPKFNYANPVVTKFLNDSAVYFANEFRVDGFRFDATYFIYNGDTSSPGGNFLYHLTRNIRSRVEPDPVLIAENLPNDSWLTESSGAAFSYQWNADFAHTLKKLFSDGSSAIAISGGSSSIEGLLSGNSYGGWAGLNYMTSHDEVANGKQRTAADLHYARGWGDSPYDAQCQTVTALATVLFSTGIPMIWQGDETLSGYYDDSYWGPPYNARYFTDSKPLYWNNEWVNRTDSYPNRTEAANLRHAVQDLIWIRRNNDYNATVSVNHRNDTDKVIGFYKGNLYVVINYNKIPYDSYDADVPSEWNLIFKHPSSAYGLSDNGKYLPEYGVLVYRQ